jgi:hypothetical protein
MTWLETIFRYAPDGGNGSAEALLLLALMIAFVSVRTRKQTRGAQRVNR